MAMAPAPVTKKDKAMQTAKIEATFGEGNAPFLTILKSDKK